MNLLWTLYIKFNKMFDCRNFYWNCVTLVGRLSATSLKSTAKTNVLKMLKRCANEKVFSMNICSKYANVKKRKKQRNENRYVFVRPCLIRQFFLSAVIRVYKIPFLSATITKSNQLWHPDSFSRNINLIKVNNLNAIQ